MSTLEQSLAAVFPSNSHQTTKVNFYSGSFGFIGLWSDYPRPAPAAPGQAKMASPRRRLIPQPPAIQSQLRRISARTRKVAHAPQEPRLAARFPDIAGRRPFPLTPQTDVNRETHCLLN
ncbi:hypothetical protein CMEL01_00364 [Colletotrichum melonis]|uniref:Uncharacterized protein n=2 Tax=Colletotrichum acutatum species complex TaxID=2707335 RepID=A0AAI9Y2Q0_9PEZI|nr:hypothetical protein CMEL01_00364 [Colletotrichum melonis]